MQASISPEIMEWIIKILMKETLIVTGLFVCPDYGLCNIAVLLLSFKCTKAIPFCIYDVLIH